MTLFFKRILDLGSRPDPAVAAMIFSSLVSSLIISGAAAASSSVEANFQRDLESLFGASVSSKHGDVSIRQRKDELGRIRKQILSGADFAEIQLDEDGDGSVDYWEVTRGPKVVAASQPYRGKFLRLTVSDRFSQGIQESTYLLDLSGRSYNLLKTKFTGKAVRYRAEVEETFEASDVKTPAVVPSEAVPPVNDIEARATRFELDEAAMIEHQTQVMGVDYNCEAKDSVGGRLSALQREWWKILKVDLDQKSDRLGILLTDSKVFDSSCKVPARKKEFEKMVEGLSKVMLSSSKGEPSPTDQTRGRYLRCLEQSGLGVTAAQMEQSFLRSLNDPYRTKPAIACSFRPGNSGASVPAEMNPYYNQVTVFMTAADEGKKKNADGSPFSYANVLFHEFIHVAGMLDENMTHAAQGCCGDDTEGRPAACRKLDRLVEREKRLVSLETHLARTSGDLEPLAGTFENVLGDSNIANNLYRSFLADLDNHQRGSPPARFENGLINDAEFSKCVARDGEVACRIEWTETIREFSDEFFKKSCKNDVPKSKKRACTAMASPAFTDKLARNIADSMISTARGSGLCGDTKAWNMQHETLRNAGWVGAFVTELIFGREANANNDDPCAVEVTLPSVPVPAPPRIVGPNELRPALPDEVPPVSLPGRIETGGVGTKRVTPGESDIGYVGGTDGRVDQSGSSDGRRPGRRGSPLPVSRVDSKNSKSFVENRYRRATDFAGSASRGLSAAREALLPTASAATAEKGSRKSRLGPGDTFIAFRPDKIKEVKITPLDNPFAVRRGLASVGGMATASSKGSSKDSPVASNASNTSDGGSSSSGSAPSGVDRSAAPTRKAKGVVTNAAPLAPKAMAPLAAVGGLSPREKASPADPLAGLFTLRYREIQDRLKRFDVLDALANRRIQILDAQGKSIGSKRPVETFVFVGIEEPLRKSSE